MTIRLFQSFSQIEVNTLVSEAVDVSMKQAKGLHLTKVCPDNTLSVFCSGMIAAASMAVKSSVRSSF